MSAMNSRRLIRFPRAEDVIVPRRVALFRRAQAIAGGVLTHPRRGSTHRRQHRQAAGAAAQATDLYRPHFRYDLNAGYFAGRRGRA